MVSFAVETFDLTKTFEVKKKDESVSWWSARVSARCKVYRLYTLIPLGLYLSNCFQMC